MKSPIMHRNGRFCRQLKEKLNHGTTCNERWLCTSRIILNMFLLQFMQQENNFQFLQHNTCPHYTLPIEYAL